MKLKKEVLKLKIRYTIKKHNQLSEINNKDMYLLWKQNKYSSRGIFQGSKKECEEKLREMKGK